MLMSLHGLGLTIVFLFPSSSLAGHLAMEELDGETWLFLSDSVLDVLNSFILLCFTFPVLLNSNEKASLLCSGTWDLSKASGQVLNAELGIKSVI